GPARAHPCATGRPCESVSVRHHLVPARADRALAMARESSASSGPNPATLPGASERPSQLANGIVRFTDPEAKNAPGLAQPPGVPGLAEVSGLPGLGETAGLAETPGLPERPGLVGTPRLPKAPGAADGPNPGDVMRVWESSGRLAEPPMEPSGDMPA